MVNHGYDNYCHISSDVSKNIFILYVVKTKSQIGQFHFFCNLTKMFFFFSLLILLPIFLCNLTNIFFFKFTYFVTLNYHVSYCGSKRKTGVFNKAIMEKIVHVMTIRAKEVRDRDFIFSYDLASKLDLEYILKTIMKHFIKRNGREKKDSNLLVYEHFDTIFEEWLKVNESMKEGNLTKPFLQIRRRVRRLSYLCRFEF